MIAQNQTTPVLVHTWQSIITKIKLTYKDLQTALAANTAVWINVGEQSLDQLMAIKISVTRASGSEQQKIRGLPWKKPK